eukprot:gnl/MRDRNA2_/MRDRNA2_114750_c0_seq1.p3 gnl/MRDRNA2_/MRDRNA2_114750_c0~~gnl/MRDRNA2_/MRDRNA2_114750_c0_seq1.p3  ORF type:complete len:167 (-),score=24.22 gnl/MRDRNA2_/MRDRNA2_114750_c0_seq1:1140-1640(-)
MEKLINEFSVGLFFWQSLIFLVLLFLLRKFAWKPILNAVNEREEFIEQSLEDAHKAKDELQRLKAKNEDLIKEARVERDELLKSARAAKDSMINEAKDTAKKEADKILEAARATIETEKLAAIAELKNSVAALSIDIAEKIIKEELSSEDKQKKLVSNMLEEVSLN